MDQQRPLLVFETNILIDIWLGRGDQAVLLLELGEQKVVDLILPSAHAQCERSKYFITRDSDFGMTS